MWSRSFATCLLSLCLSVGALAQQFAVVSHLPLPSNDEYWDYLITDDSTHRLYITHGDQLQIMDLGNGKLVATISGLKRIHGVALAHEFNKGFVTDSGDNTVVVFDLRSFAVLQRIKAGQHPDAIVYEPTKKRVYAFNPHSQDATVIDAANGNVIATVPLHGSPEFAATDARGNVYVNLEDKHSLVHFDQQGTSVAHEWSLSPCESPSGLAIDPTRRRLFSVCFNKVMIVTDADTGKRIAEVPIGEDPDAAIYDGDRKLVFSSNSDGTLTVIRQESADKYTVLQNLITEREARTMGLDRNSGKLYLPGAKVRIPAPKPGDLPRFYPETVHMIVVAPQP